ncbi:MAG: ABC transporter substrate-binding protein [Chitinophagales bacterium]
MNIIKISFYLIFLCFILYACNTQEGSKDRRKFFRYNQQEGITSLDPAFAKNLANIWAVNQLYNGLVQIDDGLNVQPAVAKSWEISEDGLTYTFHLRNDVHFHQHELFGETKSPIVTAYDVEYSLNRIIDTEVASTGAWLFNNRVATTEPFKALNDTTFQMTLLQPFRPMLGILSMQYCSIVPKVIVEHFGKEFRKNPIGTGAFKLKSWREGDVLVMEKNEAYFEKDKNGTQLPYIDGIRVTFMDNLRTAFLKFKEGELDLLSGIDATYKDDLLSKEGELLPEWKDKINLLRSPYLNTEYLGILMKTDKQNKALNDKRVRQAINYGFDREKMIKFLRNNVGVPATSGFVPKGLPSFNANKVKGYTYNPPKAQTLLKEAGYENGNGLPTIKLETTSAYKDLCTFIQSELADIGFKIELEIHPGSFLREKITKGEAQFFRASWIGDYPDAETYLTVLYGGNPAPPNYTQFNNAEYNALYEAALLENDDAKRYEMYQSMDKILIEEAPIVPLYYDEVLRFTQKNIEGMGINAFNWLYLKEVRID